MAGDSSGWGITEALGTVGAALFAAVQILLARRDSNKRATIEHLREIDKRIQLVWTVPVKATQKEILECYSGTSSKQLSDDAQKYLALLNALDVLALGIRQRVVDYKSATDHVRTLLSTNVVSLTFIDDLRKSCSDPCVYEDLRHYFLVSHTPVISVPQRIIRFLF